MPVQQQVRSARHVTKDDLLFLLKRKDFDILCELNKTEFGFFAFLQYSRYKERGEVQYVEIVTELLSRVCNLRGERCLAHVNKLFRCLKDCQVFLYDDIPRIINSCFTNNPGINLALFLSQYMNILKAALRVDFFPCERILNEIFPALENYMNRLCEKKFKNIETSVQSFKDLKKEIEYYEAPIASDEEEDAEINSFRSTSIVPRDNEILNYEVSTVPQNIIDRPYKSVEHYLSVHYRLMREDMLRSFRECVHACVSSQGQTFSSNDKGLHFEEVNVISPAEYMVDGICYNIHVKSSKEYDLSKKGILLPGSLIFLTHNSFQSVVFATVKSNPSSSKGNTKEWELKVKLEDDLFNSSLEENFTYEMIQPSAYFECYKHVLLAIKDFKESNFPLSDILTYFDFDDSVPYYLEDKEFCLHEKCGSLSKHIIESLCKCFNPLKDEWPSLDDLKLDEQQYIAFKTAITKKVAVLQGPPGTGKTYIGKMVVKALLENTRSKATDEISATPTEDKLIVRDSPIVICCLTNHALDQFLEGLISEGITNKIVRLGSQSKSEVLETHKLSNLMCAYRKYLENASLKNPNLDKDQQKSLDLLQDIASNVLKQKISPDLGPEFFQLRDLCNKINATILSLSMCEKKYLKDSALNDIIDRKYKDNLRNTPGQLKKSLSASILEWLTCSHSSDLYNKCQKYFLDFKKRHVSQPSFENVWNLTQLKRFELFYCWRKLCLDILKKDLEIDKDCYKNLKLRYKCSVDPVKLQILTSAFVIGVTTTGAAKYKDLIRLTQPRIMIIEEAAQVLESHVIASLVPSIQHLILIGDHEQLRPLPANHELSEKYNLKISMFERLFRNNAPSATLVSQHRMKPCIAELLVPKPYTNYTSYENVYKYEEIRGVQSSVFFFHHCEPEDVNSSGTSSSNKFEAQMIVCLAKYFVLQAYSVKDITILATYAAQVKLIYEYLDKLNLSGILATTVDNFQGEENEIILLSFVRNNPTSIGFLKESNRVCVALSRAKKGMFCFGNFELFASKNDLWKDIIDKTRINNMLGDTLVLKCDKHQSLYPSKNQEDILSFINIGCPAVCDFLLPCNHRCKFTCHFKDPDHLHYLCKEQCERMMDENRVCPRLCFEKCKRIKKKQVELLCGHFGYSDASMCFREIQRILHCGHIITVPCHLDTKKYKCEAPATVNLQCGHANTICCYELAEKIKVVCSELRPETGVCGHVIYVPCHLYLREEELIPFCDKSCGTLLDCGHPCVGFCKQCFDTSIHSFCAEKCDLVLSCGHKCKGYCNSPCQPCRLKCFFVCPHGTRCINECLRPCVKCEKPCSRRCKHVRCTKECHEKCDVKPCIEPCSEILECGHQCIGLCGDPCPNLCSICNDEDFDTSNPENDRYVELECGHIIEINELDGHVEDCLISFEWPCCPRCSQVIIQNSRYKESLMKAKEECIKGYDTSEAISEIFYLVESMYGEDFIVPAQFLPIHNKIMHILKKQNPLSDALFILKNCVMLLKRLVLISSKLDDTCNEKIESKFDTLLLWICNKCNHQTKASFQQLKELELAVEQLMKDVS